MHFAGRMKLWKFLEKFKDGFIVPDYHGGFHWHFNFAGLYENNIFIEHPKALVDLSLNEIG